MRHIIVGDIHGCHEELRELISKAAPEEGDEFISVGDVVHKGPNSEYCMYHLLGLEKKGISLTIVMGNHEEKQCRWWKKVLVDKVPPEKVNLKITGMQSADANMYEDAMVRLIGTKLYCQFTSGGELFTVVHGGIPPNMPALPTEDRYFQLPGKDRRHFGQLMRARFVEPNGGMVTFGTEEEHHQYWARLYDGRVGTVFFGHETFFGGPKIFEHAYGIDTGCVHGGHLTAAIVEDGKVDFISVKAKQEYKPFNYKRGKEI